MPSSLTNPTVIKKKVILNTSDTSKKKDAQCLICSEYFPKLYAHLGHYIHKPSGVDLIRKRGICVTCYENAYPNIPYRYYCHTCQDFYTPDVNWRVEGKAVLTMPCPQHSSSPGSASALCVVCNKITSWHSGAMNSRGQYFCGTHHLQQHACSAPYCKTGIHKSQPGVVLTPGGQNIYCSDCSKVRQQPSNVPMGWHPLSWDYKIGCPCAACVYLSGKDEQWPKYYTHDFYDEEWHYKCSAPGCEAFGDEAFFTYIPGTGKRYCHCCERGILRQCAGCNTKKASDEYMPTSHHSCQLCMTKSYWYCAAQCESWFPKDVLCNCNGVFPYNYSPKPIFQWASRQRANLDKIPLLGLELEVEFPEERAKMGKSGIYDSSFRAKGVKLVKEIMGDSAYVVHDGSLLGFSKSENKGGEFGFEVVTHPFTYEYLMECWSRFDRLFSELTRMGGRAWEGGRCGLHIHISRQPMTDGHQMKFIRFIYGSTNLCLAIGQRDYRDKNLAKYAPFDKEHRADFMMKIRHNQNPGVDGHYAALSSTKAPTHEARWFRGTLNADSILKNVEFVHSTWEFTRLFGFRSANEFNYIEWLKQQPQKYGRYATLLKYVETHYLGRPFQGLNS